MNRKPVLFLLQQENFEDSTVEEKLPLEETNIKYRYEFTVSTILYSTLGKFVRVYFT